MIGHNYKILPTTCTITSDLVIYLLCVGVLYDATGSFHWSFYSAGVMLFLAGFICLPLRRIVRWKERRDERKIERIAQKEMEEIHNSPVAMTTE